MEELLAVLLPGKNSPVCEFYANCQFLYGTSLFSFSYETGLLVNYLSLTDIDRINRHY